jgi:UDP-N-acetylglucosamine 1-carboxyvinyltransferase
VDESRSLARYELVKTMRASFCVLGPLLAKRKKAKVSLPGGCVIGVRPVDLHLKGLSALGAELRISGGYIDATGKKLSGARIYLGGPFGSSVTGTANVMMAAVLAKGKTVIENAACEPEVQELAHLLNKMGAKIEGIGQHRLIIEGVDSLGGAEHEIIPDRIEAGTFMVASAITEGDVILENVLVEQMSSTIETLLATGAEIETEDTRLRVAGRRPIKPVDITTLPYPGFPTDLQAQFMALLCLADGISIITEKIYPDRFMHISELARMGARIRKEANSAIIQGVDNLYGAPVMASDLRASAALILAGLAARETTEVLRVYHIDRGYEMIEKKLRDLGAQIERRVDKRLMIVED